jgi:hypothetical protein
MGYYWVYNGSRAYVTNINQLYIYIICNWDVSANGIFLREEITNQWILMLFLWYENDLQIPLPYMITGG